MTGNFNDPDAFYAVLRSDFPSFVEKAFQTLHPGTSYTHNWHIETLALYLDLARQGKHKRLIFNLPPRSLKSMIISVAWPAFLMGHNPALRIICVSYGDDLARKLGRNFQIIMRQEWYKKTFPAMAHRPIRDSEIDYVTHAQGYRYATSINGPITGMGADVIIIDDPMKAVEAESEVIRSGINNWVQNTLFSRIDNADGIVALAMQRLHQGDLSGFLLNQEGYELVKIPALAPINEQGFPIYRPPGLYTRKKGEPLEMERLGLDFLEHKRKEIGEINFSAQYQQEPLPPEGNIFRKSYFASRFDLRKDFGWGDFETITVSWDIAAKTGQHNDYSAFTVWGRKQNLHYLIHAGRGRWEYPDLLFEIDIVARACRAQTVLIEDAHLGIGLIQDLSRKSTRYDVIGIRPVDSKRSRAIIQTGTFQAGKIWLPKEAGWLTEYLAEMLGFPNAKFDDWVDSTTQYLAWAKTQEDSVVLYNIYAPSRYEEKTW